MINEIIQDFKEYKSHFNEWLFLRRFNLKLTLYSKLADMHHRASGLKTRVVIVGEDRKFEIWNKRTIERAKKPTWRIGKIRLKDGSSKKVKQMIPARIPKSWGNLEINHITFYSVSNVKLTPEEREEYRIKFNAYAKRFLR
jgi:hypothetical protein